MTGRECEEDAEWMWSKGMRKGGAMSPNMKLAVRRLARTGGVKSLDSILGSEAQNGGVKSLDSVQGIKAQNGGFITQDSVQDIENQSNSQLAGIVAVTPRVDIEGIKARNGTDISRNSIRRINKQTEAVTSRVDIQQIKARDDEVIVRDNMQCINKSAIRRLAHRAGVKRMSKSAYDGARDALKSFLNNVIRDSIDHMTNNSNRKNISALDLVYGLQRQEGCLRMYSEGPIEDNE